MNKKQKTIFSFIIILFFCLAYFPKAKSASECDSLMGDDKETCEDKLDEKEELLDKIKKKEKEATTLEKQIADINNVQAMTMSEIAKASSQLKSLEEKIKFLEEEISNKQKEMEYNRALLAQIMQSYYESYQQGTLDTLITSEKFSDLLNQSEYIGQSGTKLSEVLNNIKKDKQELEEDQQELKNKKEESEDKKEELQNQNLTLQKTEELKQKTLGQTEAEKAKLQKELEDIENEIDDLESGKAGQIDYSSLPPYKKGYFTYPVNPIVISQKYGKTSFSKNYASGLHNGVDFAIKYKKVYSAKGGTVIGSGNNGRYAYGQWLAIDHGDGLVTLYGHLSKKSVSKGDKVKEGDTIGTSGNTGFSTGPHLHFSVFAKKTFEVVESKKKSGLMIPVGASIDPMKYLK